MKQVKRNKSKVWRKTYGKPFITRKGVCIGQMMVIAAHGQAQISSMICHGVPAGVVMINKAVAVAQAVVSTAKAMADMSHDMNKGFVLKQVKESK